MLGGSLKNIKLIDVLGGAAKAVDDSLKEDMERSQRAVERAAEYHLTRRKERQDREDEEEREIAKRFSSLTGFVDKNELPEGMTIHDGAFQLYNLAGGTVERADTFVQLLDKHRFEGGSVKDLITYVSDERNGVTDPFDYVKRFVNRQNPEIINAITSAKQDDQNLYSRLFKPDLDKEVKEIVDLTVPPRKTEDLKQFDLTKATFDPSKSTSAQEFQTAQDTKLANIKLIEKKINQIDFDTGNRNQLKNSEYAQRGKDIMKSAITAVGFNVDQYYNYTIPTDPKELKTFKTAYTEYVKRFAQRGTNTTNTLNIEANLDLLRDEASVKDVAGKFMADVINSGNVSKDDDLIVGSLYQFVDPDDDTKTITKLFLGEGFSVNGKLKEFIDLK